MQNSLNTQYNILYQAIENTANQNKAKLLYIRRCYIQPPHHDYKMLKQVTGTMILLVFVGSM